MSEILEGQIQRIVFRNEDSQWTVARLDDGTTIVGEMPTVEEGEAVRLDGSWTVDPRYGRQFKVEQASVVLPSTLDGIEKFLSSGMIPGIGKQLAARITAVFDADEIVEVLSDRPEELTRVDGIGKKRAQLISQKWAEKAEFRNVMIALAGFGISPAWAARLIKQYGHNVVGVIQKNPYQLIRDVIGIGFRKADDIALDMGFDPESAFRIKAALTFVLKRLSSEGHLYCEDERLLNETIKLTGIDRLTVSDTLDNLLRRNDLVGELSDAGQQLVFLPHLHEAESDCATRIAALQRHPSPLADRVPDDAKLEYWVSKRSKVELAEAQLRAATGAFAHKVVLITGGPGTGKTTLTQVVVSIFERLEVSCALAAPTGRAAKRLAEATRTPAKTLHRLLEYSPRSGQFERNAHDQLEVDLLLVDESSMIDILLFQALLAALPASAHLILIGDADQLPSVGPGNVLRDLINSGSVPTFQLDTVFRQADQSLIVQNAHRINRGEVPLLDEVDSDFFFIERKTPESIAGTLSEVSTRIESRFGFSPLDELQVITPMHRGLCGTRHVNQLMQDLLNPHGQTEEFGHRRFRVGDRVMQVRNNYDKEVFNGDVGRLEEIGDDELIVSFERRRVAYSRDEIDNLLLAYAITVHKSQGSEYPAVILLLHNEHYLLLQRNLLYTAVTRARKLVVVIGSRKALSMALNNDRVRRRNTRLAWRLTEAKDQL